MSRAFVTSNLDVVSTFNLNKLQKIAYNYYSHCLATHLKLEIVKKNKELKEKRSDVTAFKIKFTAMVSSKLPLKISTGFRVTTTSENIESLKKTETKKLKSQRTNHRHHQAPYSSYDTLLSTVYKDSIFLV